MYIRYNTAAHVAKLQIHLDIYDITPTISVNVISYICKLHLELWNMNGGVFWNIHVMHKTQDPIECKD